ncbi:4-alpha-glucanotransferase [Rubritalea halochordaticola]|uniref:4-alpha-glucanotransferase n=1 Tax=Rubritalea halochordaticola TaxID=714537 RepID=A0ABP9V4D1_9BACT
MVKAFENVARSAGLLFPVFSMRRSGDLGIGDTSTVKLCLDWLAKHKVGFLQLLPINVSGMDNSPYAAISSVALDFIYVDVSRIPEIGQDDIEDLLDEFGRKWLESDRVDYHTVKLVKGRLLRKAYQRYVANGDEDPEFTHFCKQEKDWLQPYCRYRWLMEEANCEEDWTRWPEEFNTAEKALAYEKKKQKLTDGGPEGVQLYYAWVQWHAFKQWWEVRDYADDLGIKLMGDIPIGVSCASADVFFEQQWFDLDWFGGAPPEKVFKDDPFACKWGQNWGVPLYNWDKLQKDKYSWWCRRIEKLTDVFHIFRIDHILGFYRIYAFPWHPKRNAEFLPLSEAEAKALTGGRLPQFMPRPDDTMKHKAQNLMDGDRYLKAVLKAADGYEVVGEDLGCVPDYVRPHLEELGVAGFKICHWETDQAGRAQPPESHHECSFATYTTHDHPPIKGIWEELRKNVADGCTGSGDGLRILCEYAGMPVMKNAKDYGPFDNVLKWELLEALLKSNARYACMMYTDLLGSDVRINTPATVGDHNWTCRAEWLLDDVPDEVEREASKLAVYIDMYHRNVYQRVK